MIEEQNFSNLSISVGKNTPSTRYRVVSFVWQHILLLVSLFIMTLGVALTIRSYLGSSVISSVPMVMTLAGGAGLAPALTVGDYTNIMNCILVGVQILIMRRKFEKVQLFQLGIGTVFGFLLDLSMYLTSPLSADSLLMKSLLQLAGCVVLGIGIAFELKCGSITMPGEGVPAAIHKITGIPFPKAKIITDISLVVIAVAIGYFFFDKWLVNVVGPGTLFAMIFVGLVVKFVTRRIGWFDSVLELHGFGRKVFGLMKSIVSKK